MAQLGTPKSFLDEKIALYDFLDPSIPHDRVLIVENKKFYVLSGNLSLTSEFFNTMFNGSFREKNETEILLPDVAAADFQNFLSLIYPMEFSVNETNLGGLMQLAARFLSPIVWQTCMKFLEPEENFKKFDMLDLLEWSKEYNSIELKERIETFLIANFHLMEDEQQFNYMLKVDPIYDLQKLACEIINQIKKWTPSKQLGLAIYFLKYSEDPSLTESTKKSVDDYIRTTLNGFKEKEQYFNMFTADDLHCYEELLVVFLKNSQFTDTSELELLLRLAEKCNFDSLKNLIANNLSEQFLLNHSFEHLEIAVKYNLESLKTSMENYLKTNAGSIPEEAKNNLLNSSSEAKNFAFRALLQHKCENGDI